MSEAIKIRKKATMWTTETFRERIKEVNQNIEVLGEYVNAKTKIKCRCLVCNELIYPTPDNLLSGKLKSGCRECTIKKKNKNQFKTHEQFLEEFYKKNDKSQNIEILGSYRGYYTGIKCMCKIDNYKWNPKPSELLNGCGCPVCGNLICVEGINDVATLRPDLIKYFNNIDDSKKYTLYSNKKVLMKCPDCNSTRYMIISNLTNTGFKCTICSDSISYPNKFLRSFLSQLPNLKNVKYEYSPTWAKKKRYDGYFEYNNKKYVIEMDGAWHSEDNNLSGITAEESIKNDNYKDNLAYENNHIMIRIDCKQSDKEYISNNISNSKLRELFDLSIIDWDKCDKFATKNIAKEVCDYYKENINITTSELMKIFDLSRSAILSYLNKGTKFGWCNYSGKEQSIKSGKYTSSILKDKKVEPVIAKDKNNNVICEADNIYKIISKLQNIYPNVLFRTTYIRKVCKHINKTHRGLIFEYIK